MIRRLRTGGNRSVEVIEVQEGGLLTTVQDLGRYGYQRYGVPVAGAVDPFALRVANVLAGNEEGAAGLEITLAGPSLHFLAGAVIAITGGDLDPRSGRRAGSHVAGRCRAPGSRAFLRQAAGRPAGLPGHCRRHRPSPGVGKPVDLHPLRPGRT